MILVCRSLGFFGGLILGPNETLKTLITNPNNPNDNPNNPNNPNTLEKGNTKEPYQPDKKAETENKQTQLPHLTQHFQ